MMKKRLMPLMMALILALSMAALNPALADETATVKGGWLILRDAPSYSGNIISSYATGTVVTITGQVGSWYAVIAPDGRTGYMLSTYLTPAGAAADPSGATGNVAYVTSANGLNVRLRTGPGTGYSIIASYAPGTQCTVLSNGASWSRIQIGGYTGYMMSQFLTSSPTPTAPPVVPTTGYDAWVTSRNGYGVNLRSGPGKNYPSIGYYSVGSPATVMSPGAVWSYISIGSRTGYMMTEFLTTTPVTPVTPVSSSPVVVSANGRNVNLRSGPGKGYGVIGSYAVGTPLEIIARGTEWYYIRISGKYGYMMKQYISDNGLTSPVGISPATATDLR